MLLDLGISLRRIKTGLARRALTPDDLSAVLITHEHSDHVAGLPMLLKYYKNVKVYAPQTVAHALERAPRRGWKGASFRSRSGRASR